MNISRSQVIDNDILSRIENISQSQQDRISYLDFRLRFFGTVGRQDIVNRFGIKAAAATRDIALYRRLASQNLEYDTKSKTYIRSELFNPVFESSRHQVLMTQAHGFGDEFESTPKLNVVYETPTLLSQPQVSILSVLTRAIYQKKPVSLNYRSLSSGKTTREIAPFALVDNGLRWHVRAFDRKQSQFIDLVINRIANPKLLQNSRIENFETKDNDIQWNRIVDLEIVPHPKVEYPDTIKHEYAMTDGTLYIKVRAAMAGYTLRRWNVDCTQDHELDGSEYHLWLKNREALHGVKNLLIAPGYKKAENE